MEKLKNCPFCGGRAYLETHHRAFINAKTTKVAFVRCMDCNARSGRVKLGDYGKTSYSIEANRAVAKAWNERVYERTTLQSLPEANPDTFRQGSRE